jgi:predicted CopG family antitoxin
MVMKKIIFLASVLCISKSGHTQTHGHHPAQFSSAATQTRMSADSVNSQLKNSLYNITRINLAQAQACYVQLENEQIREALEDIKANISFEDFIQKYTCKKTEKDLRVTRFQYKNRENRDVVEFASGEANEASGHHMNFVGDTSASAVPHTTAWLFEYHEKTDLFNEVLQAFYFTGDFFVVKIPAEYTALVQQSISAVDTMSEFFRQKYTDMQMKMQEAKQLENSWSLISHDLAEQATRRKRRELIVSGVLNWLPVLLLSRK